MASITAVSMCDVYRPTATHLQPVVVAGARHRRARQCDGTCLLVALVSGFETATRIAAGIDYAAFRSAAGTGLERSDRSEPLPPWAVCSASGRTMATAFGLAGSQAASTPSRRGQRRQSSFTSSAARCQASWRRFWRNKVSLPRANS